MGKNSRRQELMSKESISVLQFSLQSLAKAAVHPYCLEKIKTCLKPIIISALAVYFVGMVLMIPLIVVGGFVSILTGGRVERGVLATAGNHALSSAVSLVPFVALVLLRSFIRKPLFKCFIHLLREVNPPVASSIESSSAAQNASSVRRKKSASKYINKIAYLLALEVVLHFARKSPYLGRPAVAVTHFYTMKKVLGRERSLVLSLFGLIPWIEPWLLKFVQLWRTSNVLGQELVVDYVARFVDVNERSKFYKEHDVDIAIFALPGSILLQVPVVGPLAFFAIQASAAFLVDKIAREDKVLHSSQAGPIEGRGPASTVPTKPKGPHLDETDFSTAVPTLPKSPHPMGTPSLPQNR